MAGREELDPATARHLDTADDDPVADEQSEPVAIGVIGRAERPGSELDDLDLETGEALGRFGGALEARVHFEQAAAHAFRPTRAPARRNPWEAAASRPQRPLKRSFASGS
jgi:hypothetical protein